MDELKVKISIHALREEGDPQPRGDAQGIRAISIHALREEDDAQGIRAGEEKMISIHALREEGD